MSNKTSNQCSRTDMKPHPTILRRKRKTVANSEVEVKNIPENDNNSNEACSKNCDRHKEDTNGNKTPVDLVSIVSFSQVQSFTCLFTPESSHMSQSPLPYFKWADSQEVWDVLVKKDQMYTRNHDMFSWHPALSPRMRAILFNWLIEVCDSYRLHRSTMYLAQDFVDRYLSSQKNIPKDQLQLVGVTGLFIASKMEEIYPPKVVELADITDGCCTGDEILIKEMVILKSLNWNLTPITVNSWLNIYMQLAMSKEKNHKEENFLLPNCSSYHFVKMSQLIDLCILDVDCLQFSYRTLAAAAVYLMMSERMAISVSGLQRSEISVCSKWMLPFALTIHEHGEAHLKTIQEPLQENMYNIQYHNVDMNLLDKAKVRQNQMLSQEPNNFPSCELSPPDSDKKKRRTNL